MVGSADLQKLEAAFQDAHISDQVREFFRESWKEKGFRRHEFITEAGKTERHFYFALEGIQALYLISRKGDKVILGFSYEGNFSGVFDSFLNKEPSSYFLECLTDSKLLCITFEKYQELFDRFPEFYEWGKKFGDAILFGRLKREVELLTMTAEQRYAEFMRRCPPVLREIPQKYLASYLNMKPETFSRLRRTVDY